VLRLSELAAKPLGASADDPMPLPLTFPLALPLVLPLPLSFPLPLAFARLPAIAPVVPELGHAAIPGSAPPVGSGADRIAAADGQGQPAVSLRRRLQGPLLHERRRCTGRS